MISNRDVKIQLINQSSFPGLQKKSFIKYKNWEEFKKKSCFYPIIYEEYDIEYIYDILYLIIP